MTEGPKPNLKATEKRIILVSDGTGETASKMMKAAMVQFDGQKVKYSRYKNVRSESQVNAIVEDAAVNQDFIIYTIVSTQLSAYLAQKTESLSVPCVDLLGPLLVRLAGLFGYKPKLIAGLLHDINERYFQRIDAMEYTIAHDDGRNLSRLKEADLVIVGISRTSKTPLSMYLSHQGWRVANIPVIKDFELPKELFEVDPKKVIALTIDPEHLAGIRRARLGKLGQNQGGEYADLERVSDEINYATQLYRKNRKWPVFNVTGKALEETASEIIKLMGNRKILPQ